MNFPVIFNAYIPDAIFYVNGMKKKCRLFGIFGS